MKRLFLFCMFVVAALFNLQPANAKTWRVNSNSNYNGTSLWGDNFGGTATNPVFKQLYDANSSNLVSATAGDTIHLEGSAIAYGNTTITKKLIIIGPGYFLNENPNVSNDALSANLSYANFSTGSDGSQLLGIYVYSSNGISIGVSNIVIKRCKIDYSVYVGYNNSDISIIQNYFTNISNNTASAISVSSNGFPTGFVFNNNISKKVLLLAYGTTTYTAQEVSNNTFDCPAISGNPSIRLNTGAFKNNILKTAAATVNINNNTNNNVTYNVSSSATGQFGTANNNIVVATISNIFVASGTTDGLYQLKNGSAASNNGSDGTDRGAFGGAVTNRYTLSGLAPIPVIYQLTTSGVATQAAGLSVTIKARTIK